MTEPGVPLWWIWTTASFGAITLAALLLVFWSLARNEQLTHRVGALESRSRRIADDLKRLQAALDQGRSDRDTIRRLLGEGIDVVRRLRVAPSAAVRSQSPYHPLTDPLAVVRNRYARGEITREEFETKMRDLGGCPPDGAG